MRLRNRPWAAGELAACHYYISDFTANKDNWHNVFGNDRPICLEIGCGKGMWIASNAIEDPDTNFIGADIKGLVLAYGIRWINEVFGGAENVKNVRLLSVDAERISYAFGKEDQISKIVINFCNPWPKDQHKKRRLVHTRQLVQYKEFLADDGEILFKTDSAELFADSPAYFEEAGFRIVEITDDYYATHEMIPEKMTEHEAKFTSMGMPIHFLRAIKNN